MKLDQIAWVNTGYQLRNRQTMSLYGTYACIKMRNVLGDKILYEDLTHSDLDNVKEKHLIRRDDIILNNRGDKNTAYLIDRDLENTVTDGYFFLIRILDKSHMLPEILQAILNLDETQKKLRDCAYRTTNQAWVLLLKEVKEIEIPHISMEKQKHIANYILSITEEENVMLNILAHHKMDLQEMVLGY